ncbi:MULTISPECIES: hypothetical protein [unclassified Nocardia]|nr:MULTISPECIES: hypothetical protein [unclassified Nocardia]
MFDLYAGLLALCGLAMLWVAVSGTAPAPMIFARSAGRSGSAA